MSKFNRKLFLRNTPVVVNKPFILSLIFFIKRMRLHFFGYLDKLWWKCVPGTIITVPFPIGREIDNYRETLEALCGQQFIGWHWTSDDAETIQIKFRVGNSKHATILALQWS